MEMALQALFGEKYGDFVRVITFARLITRALAALMFLRQVISVCSDCSETAVAAGVRR